MSLWQIIQIAAALIVLARCIDWAANIDLHKWDGARLRFAGFSIGAGCLCGGAVGTALGASIGPGLMLFGLAAWIVFDRRRNAQ